MHVADLSAWLTARFAGQWSARELNSSGFCATWRAESGDQRLFIKAVPVDESDVLSAEVEGLRALAESQTIRVPAVVDCWLEPDGGTALLAMEWLELAVPDAGFAEKFGRALALLHRATPQQGAGRFGWLRQNRLGGSRQSNRWSQCGGRAGWIEFFREQRLRQMHDAALRKSASRELLDAVDDVIECMPALFDADGHVPRPSLIHGDLWSGNWGMLADGTPVIYDPAVSCSDAEAELAMMELFGSPPPGFWPAYRDVTGMAAGYASRRALYQLYHLLNHVVLFGAGYEAQALDRAQAILRSRTLRLSW
ncbi:fructosamine kinase family protein [Povalibacter sp.]|uniref:fructosamine kinase family protein n=1 Tax=Povalibacter sp. TaxID=1962978 RepID=UPI002F423996